MDPHLKVFQTLHDVLVLSSYCEKKLTAWGSCVAEAAFAFQALPVIVRDADSLFATEKVVRFTATLFSYTIKKKRALCVTCNDSKIMLLNSTNSSFSSFFQLRHDAKGIFIFLA